MLKYLNRSRYTSPKIVSVRKCATLVAGAKKEGKTVGLCHGGFDLLHPGHLTHFESASKKCDVLVVSVTSDKHVTKRKGVGRPVFPERFRAYAISALQWVDFVVITDYPKGVDVIGALKPSFYIKGPDLIGKMTPGIISEREAIAKAGGKMVYTNDPKLSTTEIINYIQREIPDRRFLLITDRDGTLVEDPGFLGRSVNWKNEIKLNKAVAAFLANLKTKYDLTIICVSNQSGVARGYFPVRLVRTINAEISRRLSEYQVVINRWEFCPDVDKDFAGKHPEIKWKKSYVKKLTGRKPATVMVDKALKKMNLNGSDFRRILVIGNSRDDRLLADNLKARFLDVSGKSYDDLIKEFTRMKL